jgi:hypothetical protein
MKVTPFLLDLVHNDDSKRAVLVYRDSNWRKIVSLLLCFRVTVTRFLNTSNINLPLVMKVGIGTKLIFQLSDFLMMLVFSYMCQTSIETVLS